MDLSDGLINDLKKISIMSNKRIVLDNIEKVNPLLFQFMNKKDYFKLVLSSGEEFTPIMTIAPKKSQLAINLFKKKLGINNEL